MFRPKIYQSQKKLPEQRSACLVHFPGLALCCTVLTLLHFIVIILLQCYVVYCTVHCIACLDSMQCIVYCKLYTEQYSTVFTVTPVGLVRWSQ